MDRTHYRAEDFAAEESFQEYALGINPLSINQWGQWIKEHPEKLEETVLAVQMVRNLQFRNPDLTDKKEFDRQQLQYHLFNEDSFKSTNRSERNANQVVFNFWKVAATFIALVTVAYIVWRANEYNWFDRHRQAVEHSTLIEKTIPKGQKYTIQLIDGTIVKLNSESTLRFEEDLNQQKREVYLTGEAFFDVARDPLRPFIVHTGSVETCVLGTAFNLRAYSNEKSIEVALIHGKIKVKNNQSPEKLSAILEPHQMIRIDENTDRYVVQTFDETAISGWTDGILYFKNAGISEIVQKLERWYNVEVQVKGELGVKAFSGEFDNESLDKVLNGIGFSLHFQYSIKGRKVVIQPNES